MMMEKRLINFVVKKSGNNYNAVLSSDSVDRDEERIGLNLLKVWAGSGFSLPMLTDHQNSIDALVGQWKDKTFVEENGTGYLKATPVFISKCNPKGDKIKAALDSGMPLGVSIGFAPTESQVVTVNNKQITEFTAGSLLEASWTPVPANQDAYGYVAKSLNIIDHDSKQNTTKNINGDNTMTEEKPVEAQPAVDVQATPTEQQVEQPKQEEATKEEPVSEEAPVESVEEEVTEEPAPAEEVVETPEKSADTQTLITKATSDLNTKLDKAINLVKTLEKSNKELEAKIKKLEKAPIRRAELHKEFANKDTEAENSTKALGGLSIKGLVEEAKKLTGRE